MESRTAWLASYPKSGNTWVRLLLSTLETNASPNLNRLAGATTHDKLDQALGISLGDLSPSETAAALRLSWALAQTKSDKFVRRKTHRAWVEDVDGYPVPWQPEPARAILVVRDPRAVVASLSHHMGFTLAESVAFMGRDHPRAERLDAHGEERYLSWSHHTLSWLDGCALPRLVVHYEDLISDAERELDRMATFLGFPASREQIAWAVSQCNFETLASREIFEGFRESPTRGKVFFRKGQVDAWKKELPSELAQQIVEDHGPVMGRLGYL